MKEVPHTGLTLLLMMFALCLSTVIVHADTLNSSSCDSLYGLPTGTISTAASLQYMNPTVCAAYQDLISRYSPGNCGSIGFSNAKVQGITSLNSTFALNLDNMLKAADGAGYHITITSAFRSTAGEQCANSAAAARGFVSMHSKGLAADLNFPGDPNSKSGCDSGEQSAAYLWVQQNDSTYNLGSYNQLHSHVGGECNHVEAKSGTTDGSKGPGLGTATPTTPLQALGNLLGLNTGNNGQNGQQATNNQNTQAYCYGNTIMYQDSLGNVAAGQTCPSGCLNGVCSQTSCPAGYTSSNGTCIQQTCPTGYTMVNGLCNQTQQQAQQATQAASTASTPASTASTQGTTGTTATTQSSGGTTAASNVSSPTLVPSLLTPSSAASLLQALANPQSATTSATTTPIVLNAAVANSIAQLQAVAPPGVTYAMPSSAYFPATGTGQQNGSASTQTQGNGGDGSSGNSTGITTTAGTGYDMTGGNTSPTTTTGTIATDVTAPSGVDTFTSNDSGVTANTPSTYNAASTFSNGPLSILAVLKAEVISAINFLSFYTKPFGGNVPSQMTGE